MLRWTLLLACIVFVEAGIFRLTIEEGTREVVHLKSFGFLGHPKSNCTIIIRGFKWLIKKDSAWVPSTGEPENPIGFALESRETINSARLEENVRYPPGQCFVDWKRDERLSITLPTVKKVQHKRFEWEIPNDVGPEKPLILDLSENIQPGFTSMFFYNCNPDTRFSFDVEVQQYNKDHGHAVYLDVGKQHLPLAYVIFGCVFFMAFIVWAVLLIRHSVHVHKIHYLMGLLVFLKFLSLVLEAGHLLVISIHGHGALYADVPYYTTLTIKGALLFFVILLVGTGWSFIKPFLTENEKKIVLVVVPLMLVDSVAVVIEDNLNEGNAAWATWRDIRRILDVIACCAVLLPVVWSIRNLREATAADGKAARSLVRLRQFRTFYALLVAYIYYTRIVVPLIKSALHWEETWIAPVSEELGTMLFYFTTGYKFRPMEDNPYLNLQQEDFDDVALRAEIEAAEMEMEQAASSTVVEKSKVAKV
jgi:hypothetical protein|eukprot:CAMPEP_0174303546 /NCGR_PEP_ID=MMETSP0809-20121228/60246_1 /TAXON_ID=73025 ORGANISM="Eutreptiella gymnastica-like, Strain CCMP1594" /NCGR_SAMPLE_ID=MMETSP0809 /ASSEMBLY_ACC=CAM_ASM_000658 /LENGTH=476 /DNA_ID=CAMNT_0015409587 /DNA_START=18 /DNA_END=1448 /DNA_ORIENTATION=+